MIALLTVFVLVLGFTPASSNLFGNINNAIEANFNEDFGKSNLTAYEYITTLFGKVDHEGIEISDGLLDACSSLNDTENCRKFLNDNCADVHSVISQASVDLDGSVLKWSPSLLYHAYSPACTIGETGDGEEHPHVKMPSEKVWGYGIGFIAIILGVANVGGLMTPFMKHRFFQRMLMFCVALAVGTLGATGMLVLIPEALDLTSENSPVPDFHYKMATVMSGIYFFYVTERLLKFWFHRNEKKEKKGKEREVESKTVSVDNGLMLTTGEQKSDEENTMLSEDDVDDGQITGKKEVSTVALMILIGDALHNFVDGIAIGAAFTENTYLGISVSLSVICEELPHELGDIAILLHTGLSMRRSLCYNFIAALTIVVGLVIGVLLGENTNANMWIFAVAGGMFVYISLVDMLPEMANQAKDIEELGLEGKWTIFIIQNIGLIVGFCIILMIVMYGHNISV